MQTIYLKASAGRKTVAYANRCAVLPALAHLETPDAILAPSIDDTLTFWKVALASAQTVTVKNALRPFANGRACGTAHVGYRRHRKNTTWLVQCGVLIQSGMDAYGAPLYRLASPADVELGPCATEGEKESWFRQDLDFGGADARSAATDRRP